MYNPNNYFFPGYGMMMPRNMMGPVTRGVGLFRNLGRGMGFFKNINWSGLFSNTSRALGVVNQAIPIVKQAGPMFNNMKSMLKVASAFKDVTDEDTKKDTRQSSNLNNNRNNSNYSYGSKITNNNSYNLNEVNNFQNNYTTNGNNPNFFI